MGEETRKANRRRVHDPLFRRVFSGRGIDIGDGGDRLDRDDLFPQIVTCDGFDVADGDAQNILNYLTAESYDFVYSSHCLEHMSDPMRALQGWFSLVKPSGYLILVVPDEDLYEQGNWPSQFNADHKWSFTLMKRSSWSPQSISLLEAMTNSLSSFSFVRMSLLDDEYDYALAGVDQSLMGAEVGIEIVIQKHSNAVGDLHGQVDVDKLLKTGSIVGNSENLDHRLPTTRLCVNILRSARRRVFVECGAQTTTRLHSQGMSTAIWAAVARECDSQLWTVDHSRAAIRQCKQLTAAYDNITYVIGDSVRFLKEFDHHIDFLYLDSFDFYDGCMDGSRNHQLAEIEAAFPKLTRGSVVLLDDANVQMWFSRVLNEYDAQGKTPLSHEFLLKHGARCICDIPNYQRLYIVN